MIGSKIRTGLLILAAAGSHMAGAAPALVTIQDTLYKADGTLFNGVAYIQWRTFDTADRISIPTQTVTARITSGVLRVQLAPTTTATPQAFYQVKYNSDGKTQFLEYWSVAPSTAVLRLRDVRISSPLLGSVTAPPVNTAILIADVAGLRGELDARAVKGSGYSASRAAMINTAGLLESVVGSPTDCVRVDGSAGPCDPAAAVFADAESPAGALDGVNTSYSLSAAPSPAASLSLYRNGILQQAGLDYTLTGSSVTFIIAPVAGDILQAFYRLGGLGNVQFADAETPSGAMNGANAVFTLQTPPLPAASLQLFRNGVLLRASADYTLSGSTVTLAAASIPQASDSLLAFYRK